MKTKPLTIFKKNIEYFVLLNLVILTFFSCSKDDSNTGDDAMIEDVIFLQPCTFDIATLENNATVTIDCQYDLRGATVDLAPGVTLLYANGGEIFNGTIVGDDLTIDGNLLNSNLTIDGTATLVDPTFIFEPSRWNIIEGVVSQNVALDNRNHFNEIIELVRELDATTFEIDDFDAYFDVSGTTILNPDVFANYSIRITSNFHLKMSNQTYLRIQPSNGWSDQLLHLKGENIRVSGGNLIGDRLEHDYSPVVDDLGIDRSEHEYGSLVYIGGVINGLVENIKMSQHPGDCILVQSSGIRNEDGTPRPGLIYTKDITIRNCRVDSARRNNISLTDCENVLLEGNTVLNAGLETPENPAANGTNPRNSIDMESFKATRDEGGIEVLLEYEIIKNVTIRDNDFEGNFRGLNFFSVDGALVENNRFDDGFASVNSRDCIVTNNIFIKGSNLDPTNDRGGSFTRKIRNGIDEAINNVISENTFVGYKAGIQISSTGAKVFGNTVIDCLEGIALSGKDIQIYNNLITSTVPGSSGFFNAPTATAENLLVYDNEVNVMHRNVHLLNINREVTGDQYRLTFDNCTFTPGKDFYLNNSNNITVSNSTNVNVVLDNICNNIIEFNNN